MSEPLKDHQVIPKELGQWKLDGVTVTQSQAGKAVTWSFDFGEWLARKDRDGKPYLIGYLTHDQARELRALLIEQS